MEKVKIASFEHKTLDSKGVFGWPIWEKEISRFPWSYDSTEECWIIEGEVEITTADKTYKIKAGDFVTFEAGLECTWNILSDVKKHYYFP